MLKSFVKSTKLWIKICYNLTYQKFRNPKYYEYLKRQEAFYRTLLKDYKNDLIFDVGANVGSKSYIFSKIAKKVIAFEPSQKCLRILKVRFKNSNVTVFNVALGSQNDSLDFFEVTNNESYNSFSRKHIETTVKERNIIDINSIQSKKVTIDTVENYIKQYGKPSYIKIDVEGFEWEVIKGLKTVVPLISFEVNLPEFLLEAIQIIEQLSELSDGKYKFSFGRGTKFLTDGFIEKDEAIAFLKTTAFRVVEVYVKLEN